jgi:8-oxo-dGTP pyrophosphatase MutT (NUDIX family)
MIRRLRVAAVGYRAHVADGFEFLLVRTSAGDRWTFPKGGVEACDPTPAHGAEREAAEEAGVRGVVDPTPLCIYTHLAHLGGGAYAEQTVEAYLLRITGAGGVPEADRRPTWFAAPQAIAALAENQFQSLYADEARRVVEAALDRLRGRPG